MEKNSQKFNDSFLDNNECIFKKYKPIKKIGSGSFGNIYSAIRISDKQKFAMKIERKDKQKNVLESEAYYLYNLQGFGFPKIISYGHIQKYNILIETLLDRSLHTIFLKTKTLCGIEDLCLIGLQLLDRLEWIHSKNIIYRDVKPENFLIGIDDPNVIYVVDFGLCKKYRSSKTGKHILPKLTGKFNGTLKYASSNVVRGKESSRRDDLISLGYMLIYLLKRKLPWPNNFKGLKRQQYLDLVHSKETNDDGKIFNNLPEELVNYIKYTKNLKFEQDPDYSYLRYLLRKILFNINLNYKKLSFSWINSQNRELSGYPKKNSASRKSSPYYRIFQSIKEKKLKKITLDNLNLKNIRNDNSHYISFPNFENYQTVTECNRNEKKVLNTILNLDKLKLNTISNIPNNFKKNLTALKKEDFNNYYSIKNNMNFYLDNSFLNTRNKTNKSCNTINKTIYMKIADKSLFNFNNSYKTINNHLQNKKKNSLNKNLLNLNYSNYSKNIKYRSPLLEKLKKDNNFNYISHMKNYLNLNKNKKRKNNYKILDNKNYSLNNYKIINNIKFNN
jgi:serine/threonine protein kinase